jgi:4-amino-4-deoxy-L-arabinose transferase-like glycosyltransferase
MKKFLFLLVVLFFILLIGKSIGNITSIPLHDFDEANRAEGAKNMNIYNFFLSPIIGSPFTTYDKIKISAKKNPQLNLYYQLERPPLVFLSMILTTSIFGEKEWAYRLPSFLFGVLTIIIFYFYKKMFLRL